MSPRSRKPNVIGAWSRAWAIPELRMDTRPTQTDLYAGDQIAGNSLIVIGRSSHLILSQDEVQLTASSDSSITLPASMSQPALSHHYGSVRVRLNAAANATKLIATPHLTASGTNAVVDLEVDDQESLITVTSGNIVLSTSNGHHHAQLAAGASARLGIRTNGRLEIQPAAGLPFRGEPRTLGRPLQARSQWNPHRQTDVEIMQASKTLGEHDTKALSDIAIMPASRPKTKPPAPETAPAVITANYPDPSASEEAMQPAEPSQSIAADYDDKTGPMTLQQQFDNLTKGLLDDLPIAQAQPH